MFNRFKRRPSETPSGVVDYSYLPRSNSKSKDSPLISGFVLENNAGNVERKRASLRRNASATVRTAREEQQMIKDFEQMLSMSSRGFEDQTAVMRRPKEPFNAGLGIHLEHPREGQESADSAKTRSDQRSKSMDKLRIAAFGGSDAPEQRAKSMDKLRSGTPGGLPRAQIPPHSGQDAGGYPPRPRRAASDAMLLSEALALGPDLDEPSMELVVSSFSDGDHVPSANGIGLAGTVRPSRSPHRPFQQDWYTFPPARARAGPSASAPTSPTSPNFSKPLIAPVLPPKSTGRPRQYSHTRKDTPEFDLVTFSAPATVDDREDDHQDATARPRKSTLGEPPLGISKTSPHLPNKDLKPPERLQYFSGNLQSAFSSDEDEDNEDGEDGEELNEEEQDTMHVQSRSVDLPPLPLTQYDPPRPWQEDVVAMLEAYNAQVLEACRETCEVAMGEAEPGKPSASDEGEGSSWVAQLDAGGARPPPEMYERETKPLASSNGRTAKREAHLPSPFPETFLQEVSTEARKDLAELLLVHLVHHHMQKELAAGAGVDAGEDQQKAIGTLTDMFKQQAPLSSLIALQHLMSSSIESNSSSSRSHPENASFDLLHSQFLKVLAWAHLRHRDDATLDCLERSMDKLTEAQQLLVALGKRMSRGEPCGRRSNVRLCTRPQRWYEVLSEPESDNVVDTQSSTRQHTSTEPPPAPAADPKQHAISLDTAQLFRIRVHSPSPEGGGVIELPPLTLPPRGEYGAKGAWARRAHSESRAKAPPGGRHSGANRLSQARCPKFFLIRALGLGFLAAEAQHSCACRGPAVSHAGSTAPPQPQDTSIEATRPLSLALDRRHSVDSRDGILAMSRRSSLPYVAAAVERRRSSATSIAESASGSSSAHDSNESHGSESSSARSYGSGSTTTYNPGRRVWNYAAAPSSGRSTDPSALAKTGSIATFGSKSRSSTASSLGSQTGDSILSQTASASSEGEETIVVDTPRAETRNSSPKAGAPHKRIGHSSDESQSTSSSEFTLSAYLDSARASLEGHSESDAGPDLGRLAIAPDAVEGRGLAGEPNPSGTTGPERDQFAEEGEDHQRKGPEAGRTAEPWQAPATARPLSTASIESSSDASSLSDSATSRDRNSQPRLPDIDIDPTVGSDPAWHGFIRARPYSLSSGVMPPPENFVPGSPTMASFPRTRPLALPLSLAAAPAGTEHASVPPSLATVPEAAQSGTGGTSERCCGCPCAEHDGAPKGETYAALRKKKGALQVLLPLQGEWVAVADDSGRLTGKAGGRGNQV